MTNKARYCIIIHYDEIAVKLGNRPWFERQLVQNIKKQLKDLKYSKVQKFSARIFVNDINPKKSNLYLETLQNVMGVSSVHGMINISSDLDTIKKNAQNTIPKLLFELILIFFIKFKLKISEVSCPLF